jgi:hypothetical protein
MPLDIANMFASASAAPKTMTTQTLREAEAKRDARAAASRQAVADQQTAAERNAARVAQIKAAGVAQYASDIEALAKVSGKKKAQPAATKPAATKPAAQKVAAKPAPKKATAKKSAAKKAAKPAAKKAAAKRTRRTAASAKVAATVPAPIVPAAVAPAQPTAPALVTAMVCDLRCGAEAAPGMFVGVNALGSIVVVMQSSPAAEPRQWHPSEVVPVIGRASEATIAACWLVLTGSDDAPRLLLAG